MPRIELPTGLVGNEDLPRTRQSLTNCFNNGEGVIIPRPGLQDLATTGGVARGQLVWNGSLYQIVSEQLLKITDTDTGATSVIGTISGNAPVVSAIGFNTAVLVVQGGTIYTLDKTDTLVIISGNANFEPVDAVAHIDGRFVYIPTDGANPAFFSDIGAAGTVQPESFFDAEELPDNNTTVFNLRNTLYIGGTDSFELFRDTGASPVPFTRLTGARIDYGFIGGLVPYADTFLFVGREKDQNYGIYAIAQGRAEKVSNEAIDEILSKYEMRTQSLTVASRFKWRSYDIVAFTCGADSFGFYKGSWFLLSSITGSTQSAWGGGFINQYLGEYFTAFEDKIGKLSNINTDYGERIPRIIDLAFEEPDGEYFACQSATLGISQGYNGTVGTVGLAMSRNNVEYGPMLFRDLGNIGDYTTHLEWNEPGGLGAYEGFMGMRIYTTQDVQFAANSLSAYFRG